MLQVPLTLNYSKQHFVNLLFTKALGSKSVLDSKLVFGSESVLGTKSLLLSVATLYEKDFLFEDLSRRPDGPNEALKWLTSHYFALFVCQYFQDRASEQFTNCLRAAWILFVGLRLECLLSEYKVLQFEGHRVESLPVS